MSRVVPETDWLRRAGALTVEPEGDWYADSGGADPSGAQVVVAAQRLAVRLVLRARVVLAANDCSRTDHRSCLVALAEPGSGDLACALVPGLAAIPLAVGSRLPRLRDPAAAYLDALQAAAGAVYLCCRVQHASGECFFSAPDGGIDNPAGARVPDMCGRILAVAHRLPA